MDTRQFAHGDHTPTGLKIPVCFLAHDIDVPMNVGSLFRIADALGIERIFLTGSSPVPPNTKIRKTSRATEKYVPYAREEDPLAVVEALRAAGYRIVSLELTTASIDIRRFHVSPEDRICLILGSEDSGISQSLLNASDIAVHIPMLGHNSSMNVATACAIASFEISKRCRVDT
jgi:tRNA G18 (ribose-2'-O)-methylase SpoU